jgi:hypothetical protein
VRKQIILSAVLALALGSCATSGGQTPTPNATQATLDPALIPAPRRPCEVAIAGWLVGSSHDQAFQVCTADEYIEARAYWEPILAPEGFGSTATRDLAYYCRRDKAPFPELDTPLCRHWWLGDYDRDYRDP